jgi:DNA-binding winged helix-turn-helix (wHTH) protein/tetratricopeptide (TPR) repeat protein
MRSRATPLQTYVFGDHELDLALYELRRAGDRVSIEPKALDLLAFLIAERHRVVAKDELLEALWPREFVTEASLTYCVKAARQAIGDDGERQAIIATVRGRGYRFVAPVSEGSAVHPAAAVQHETRAPSRPIAASSFFVGREQAMATLRGALENALGGRGRIALLVGEAGIGKTRTAEELALAAGARGALVLFGRCYEGAGAPAFWPWVQVLRACLAERDPTATLTSMVGSGADLAQLVPEVTRWLSHSAAAMTLPESDQTRFRLFDSATAFLKQTAQEQPLVIVLDDLHWADTASLLLLQFLARELNGARLLVVGTYRNVRRAADHPLSHCLGELARIDTCQRIDLDGLKQPDVARFIEATTGMTPRPALVEKVAEQTGGNPFFMTELVRLLIADHQMPTGAAPMPPVPGTVREAVLRRIQLLSPVCQALLPVAAIFGREFGLPSLSHAFGRARSELLDAIDEAVAARLIEPVAGSATRFRFAHALVPETLYDAVSSRDRAALHARVGDAIASVHADNLDPYLTVLAHHYGEAAVAGDASIAVDYAVRAGRRAAASWAYEEAATQFERALHLRERNGVPAPFGRRGRGSTPYGRDALLLELGENLWKAGDFSRAKAMFQRAADLAREDRSPTQFARAALGYGGGFRGFDLGVIEPPLIDLLEEALRKLPATPSALRARLMARLAVALYHFPDSLERRQSLSRDAVAIAQRSGDAAAHLGALYSRHWAIWGPDNFADRLEAAEAMIRLAQEVGDREMALHAHRFHLIDSLEQGNLAAVDADLAACADIAAALRQPYYLWYVEYLRGTRALLEGRLADADRLAQQALAIGQRSQSRNVEQVYGGQMMWIRREQGRLAELEPIIRHLVDQYPALPSWRCGLLYVLSESGRLDEARVQLDILAAHDFSDMPRNAFWAVGISRTAESCAALGDARRARILYDLLTPYASRCIEASMGAACLGSVHHQLGRLAATMQRWSEATRHFDAALVTDARLGAPHLIAHTQREHAAMMLARGQANDAVRAGDLLARADATYRQLGMDSFAAQTATLVEHAQRLRRQATQKSSGRIRLVR